jgi:hypothetical protein
LLYIAMYIYIYYYYYIFKKLCEHVKLYEYI